MRVERSIVGGTLIRGRNLRSGSTKMKTWRQHWSVGVMSIAIGCLPFFSPVLTYAQSLNFGGSSNCTATDFDTELQFANGPVDYYSIIADKRNISDCPCVLDASVYGPSLVPDRFEGHAPDGICYFCDERLRNGRAPSVPPVTVSPWTLACRTV